MRTLLSIFCLMFCLASPAQAALSVQAEDAVKQFLDQHPSLEGREFSIQWEPSKLEFPACTKNPSVELLRKDKAWGKLLLNLRCDTGRVWARPVSLYVVVKGRYLAATRPLKSGQVLTPSDWKWVDGDLSKMGDSLVDSPELLKNMELSRAQQAGNALRLNDFRPMSVIKSGDQVRVAIVGRGFGIDASGQALADAALGASVKVRISDGKIIQGTAVLQGVVEVVME
ncbi:flagellar basal body P-ring formation chaperone FlgA [Limnohabitans sp. MMS-10A-178]|uniref:flagellar basal body P-ring formation chaperone FlgA n=1 Tax=Limnohabitans sp. MMS-10A-178 TaxID=1835767 RepID=UPI000D391BF5|nr:flagellar basal body P-ring formation chaperone FlgA [Limnohabitans sp. MMS-10A-178]PUE16493.1 flagella basal body P-ring formation protein FlgA [Limnohabitans sp. MMS-10A-178]